MKRIELTINEDGSYNIDMAEGFAGQSCAQKAANIIYTNKHLGQAKHHSQVLPLLPKLQLLKTLWYCLYLENNIVI